MEFNICIPTKGRVSLILDKTLSMLDRYGMLNNEATPVYLFVDPEDYDEYNDIYGDELRVIFGNCKLSEQRRCIRQYFNEDDKLLILDDDVDDVVGLGKNESLIDIISYCFKQMIDNDIILGSINPRSNKNLFSSEELFGLYLCSGSLYFEINKKEYWDLYIDTALTDALEDYHRTLVCYKLHGMVYRYDKLGIKKKIKKNKIIDIEKIEYLKQQYPNLIIQKKTGLSLRPNKTLFKNIYVSKSKDTVLGANCDVDNDSIIVNVNKNLRIYDKDTNELISVVLHEVSPSWDEYYGINYYFNKVIKSINSGSIAGNIQKHLLPKYIQDKYYKYVRVNPYTIKNINCNLLVNNMYDSVDLGYIKTYLNKIRLSQSSIDNNEPDDMMREYLNILQRYYRLYAPKINNEKYRFLDTDFSSVRISRSEIDKAHYNTDSVGWCCMSHINNVERYRHNFEGCDLLFTDYNICIKYNTKSLVLFDNSKIKHSNTPFIIDGQKYWTYGNSKRLGLCTYINKN